MEKLNIPTKSEGDDCYSTEFNSIVDKIGELVSQANVGPNPSLEFKILGSYQTLPALELAYPTGASGGVFLIGDNTFYVWTGSSYTPINIDILKEFSSETFEDVLLTEDSISIDYTKTPYAKVTLSGNYSIFNLFINNTKEGSRGSILVFQTGLKQIVASSSIKGSINLPLNADTVALLTYNRIGDVIYMATTVILGDTLFPVPTKIVDFQIVYSDSSTCVVQWTATYANNIYDVATAYDMRYANSEVDANDDTIWAGLKKINNLPTPLTKGVVQKMSISGLDANKEYYIYLKSIKVNLGVEYTSEASNSVFFKTLGSDDTSKAFRLSLTAAQLHPQSTTVVIDPSSEDECSTDRMVDETELNTFMDNGYPDTSNKSYTTYWLGNKYSRATSPYSIVIDLYKQCTIDRLYSYSRAKPFFSLWGMQDIGYPWIKYGEIPDDYNSWSYVDFNKSKCRFIKIAFDLMAFGSSSTNPSMSDGDEGFPDPEYNSSIDRIDNIVIYGRDLSEVPSGITTVQRKYTIRKTVDQFFCTNGHAYQQGRIHSMCSGERMRMYIAFGHFAAYDDNNSVKEAYTRIADMKFRVNRVPWISGNNGTGEYLKDTLLHTYKPYGLKPFLTNTGTFDYCKNPYATYGRACDGYWLPNAWKPIPTAGVGKLDTYFGATQSESSYKTMAKLCYALAAKYGKNIVDGSSLFYPSTEEVTTGLDLISGIEPENEPDKDWNGWTGYENSEEYAAITGASADGNDGQLLDEDGNPMIGTKGGGIVSFASGLASISCEYLLSAVLHYKKARIKGDVPVDIFSIHSYCSNIGNQGSSTASVQYGITFEEAVVGNVALKELLKLIVLRNLYFSSKEIAITEFGWGESGSRNSASKYQCYSQTGTIIDGWVIPDRHRSDVKGAWIVRACIQMMALGIDFVNYYSTECESNYFSTGVWDAGAGFEMFHWNDCVDTTPGAKVAAVATYECAYGRGGFATTGLFGNILANGAYPITRAYWWVATMRNRLKGYIYTGMKYKDSDSRIIIACFKKVTEEKGAYAVYFNNNGNSGIKGVSLTFPDGVSSVTHVTTYVPEIFNPVNVPSDVGIDHARTGMAAARHEKYTNGQWVIQNQYYWQTKEISFAKGVANYPQNPVEGDEVIVLPTTEENPYFPLVGPVAAKSDSHGNQLSANMFDSDRADWATEPDKDANGNVIWTKRYDTALAWRQVTAVCDYIDYNSEGIHGKVGDEEILTPVRSSLIVNVSEFPEYYLFDAAPIPDFKSSVEDVSAVAVNSNTINLYWNNVNVDDEAYQIFQSSLPETGFTLLETVTAGLENKLVISGLSPKTTYYFKIRPVKGDLYGTLSDSTGITTLAELQVPTNLAVSIRTVMSISLTWDYTSEAVADFVYFAIFRAGEDGTFAQIGTVKDKSIHTYKDSGLSVGSVYYYKIRAVGLDGQSSYTDSVTTSTLTTEESSPTVQKVTTDKLGTKITVTFDLGIGSLDTDIISKFTLAEDGNRRLIKSVTIDSTDNKNLIIGLPDDTLSDFDKNTVTKLSFSGGGIYSIYSVALDAFTDIKVTNVIGNYTNIAAEFKVNLCLADTVNPIDNTWNNIKGDPTSTVISKVLIDTNGNTSAITFANFNGGSKYKWGGTRTDGYCTIVDIEQVVYKNGWKSAYGAISTENILSRLQLIGVNNEHRFTVKVFGAVQYGGDLPAKLKVGSLYSNGLNEHGNSSTYMTVEDCIPDSGVLNIDLVHNEPGVSTNYPFIAFLIIDEYNSASEAENKDVYLREATINEAVDGVVKQQAITVHLNFIGSATSYRISETEDMTNVPYVDITNENINPAFTLSSAYGTKTLYVQVKNIYTESNIRVVKVEYANPTATLVLKNVYINDDAEITNSPNINLMFSFVGTPTYYRIGEVSDLSSVSWLAWSTNTTSTQSFVLSDSSGQKTVYAQIKDADTESSIKSDEITYNKP
jgi:hypothetical protein